jgi:catalase (peroxidase I)
MGVCIDFRGTDKRGGANGARPQRRLLNSIAYQVDTYDQLLV